MATQMTPEQMEIRLRKYETQLKAFKVVLERLQSQLENKSDSSDVERIKSSIENLIQDNSSLINDNKERLSKVILPSETRFYLEGSEIQDFQANFNKLKAMMIQFEKLYKNLVSYASNLNLSS